MKQYLQKAAKKTFSKFKKFQRALYVSMLKLTNKSDYSRWSQKASLFESWDERTKILASFIKPDSVVFEFGAARLVLRDFIPDNCTYIHSDIVARNESTLVIDLNKNHPELPVSDYIVFSGVLEYINDVEKVLNYCSNFTTEILFSYAIRENFSNLETRRFNGWVSDLSENDLKEISARLQWKLEKIKNWKGQVLYSLKK